MMASWSPAPAQRLPERPSQRRLLAGAEAAFRDALVESIEGLELCDRNLLGFHYFHGLTVDQLAEMYSCPRAAVARQLARIRERMLRDTRRGLAARLRLDKPELDRLLDVARSRFDLAITRVLRS
jgi:RNA polymerase sigma-70 factor